MNKATINRARPAARAANQLHAPLTPTDHRRGAPRPTITVIQYGDFQSAACRAAEPAVGLLLAAHADTVQLVFRHFPVESAHPLALMAAEATEAAAAQGQFWQMHDLLLQEGASLHRSALDQAAQTLGLEPTTTTFIAVRCFSANSCFSK